MEKIIFFFEKKFLKSNFHPSFSANGNKLVYPIDKTKNVDMSIETEFLHNSKKKNAFS